MPPSFAALNSWIMPRRWWLISVISSAVASALNRRSTLTSVQSCPAGVFRSASWRTAPEAIPDSEITKTYDVDVAIIGMGYAGLSCYRELAEEGKNVLVLEAMPRESWWTVGHDIGHINSDYLLSHGVPKVDDCLLYTSDAADE